MVSPPRSIDTVLVVNSCARGQAILESDLDLAVLVPPTATAQDVQGPEATWLAFATADPVVLEFRHAGRFTHVHVDVFDGPFGPTVWDDGGGPDTFEVEIGNRVAYAAPVDQAGRSFQVLQARWLPYYDDDLRVRRLTMVREACAYDLERVPFLLSRGLYFSAFDYLYTYWGWHTRYALDQRRGGAAGKALSKSTIDTAAQLAGADLKDVNSDIDASEAYRRAMIPVFTRRALNGAMARV